MLHEAGAHSVLSAGFDFTVAFANGLVFVLIVSALVAGVGWLANRSMERRKPRLRGAPGTVQVTCVNCRREMVFNRAQLEPLLPAEKALVVSARPAVVGKPLGEYTCPYCEAIHCFTEKGTRLEWVGVNFYRAHQVVAHCFECRKPLARPSGNPPEDPDARVAEPATLPDSYGLKCPHCHAVCCVACCTSVTRKLVRDASLLCPRCRRGPMDRLFYP